jgi:hypothetical protein
MSLIELPGWVRASASTDRTLAASCWNPDGGMASSPSFISLRPRRNSSSPFM